MPSWLKSKMLWLNIIVIAIAAIEYLVTNNVGPAVWEGLALVILNGIAAAFNAQQQTTLKQKMVELNKRNAAYVAQIDMMNKQGK